MLWGGVLMVLIGFVDQDKIWSTINFEVLAFLIGMFTIVAGMEKSGLLNYMALKIATRSSRKGLISSTMMGMGLLSSFLVNDTIALMGTPIVLRLAALSGIRERILLMALAYGVTIGSVPTPMGNPQNMLIASNKLMNTPLITFLIYLFPPTLLSLYVSYKVFIRIYKKELNDLPFKLPKYTKEEIIKDKALAYKSIGALILVIILFIANDISFLVYKRKIASEGFSALLAGLILFTLTDKRLDLLRRVDWSTILLFIGMFLFVEGLWNSGLGFILFNSIPSFSGPLGEILKIFLLSLLASQIMSNVPFTQLALKYFENSWNNSNNPQVYLTTLAASSTLAGNLTLLGAASNLIIIEAAESRGYKAFKPLEFTKVGVIITLLCSIIYISYLYTLYLFLKVR